MLICGNRLGQQVHGLFSFFQSHSWWRRVRWRGGRCCHRSSIYLACTICRRAVRRCRGRWIGSTPSVSLPANKGRSLLVAWWHRPNPGFRIVELIARRRFCRGAPRAMCQRCRQSRPAHAICCTWVKPGMLSWLSRMKVRVSLNNWSSSRCRPRLMKWRAN